MKYHIKIISNLIDFLKFQFFYRHPVTDTVDCWRRKNKKKIWIYLIHIYGKSMYNIKRKYVIPTYNLK